MPENDKLPTRRYQSWHFDVGAVLFITAEIWRDWYTPTTWTPRLARFVLVVASFVFLGLSYSEKPN
jgi:hypothetical protein